MNEIDIRFYEELNDFLPQERRKVTFHHRFNGNPSVKHVIESLGVPHVEVDLVLINGISVDFSCRLRDGDRVSVYPMFESLDIRPLQRLRSEPLRVVRFIADSHLGRLARHLRLLGFDTLWEVDYSDPEIVDLAEREKRIILTCDREMLKNGRVTHGYWIRSANPEAQLKEVLVRFDIRNPQTLFTRCLECNTPLETVNKEDIDYRLEPLTRKYYSDFRHCRDCDRIYWKGSHYERLLKFAEDMLASLSPPSVR